MSSYTMELREYIEMFSQDDDTLSTRDKIEKGRTKLFDFDYPIFDTNYKAVFETHFIRNFYMREIGFETEGLFKFQLESWLLINMPYFNKLFESELIKFDPLTNSKMDATHTTTKDKSQNDNRDVVRTGNTDETSNTKINQTTDNTTSSTDDRSGTATDDNFERQISSNTPDGRLNLTATDGEGVIEYANKIEENNENNSKTTSEHDEGSSTSNTTNNVDNDLTSNVTSNATANDKLTSSVTETEDYVQSRTGKVGVQTYSKMLTEYRDSLIRIENKIFKEMQQLFMLVY